MRCRWQALAALTIVGCATEPASPTDEGSSTTQSAETQASVSTGQFDTALPTMSRGSTSTTTGGSTSASEPSTSSSGTGSSSGGGPVGPSCSVQVVTDNALVDPLPRGESEGVFPTEVAEALEGYCGCHTVRSNAQNVAWPELLPPGGSLFLSYEDLSKPYGATTLGMAMQSEVASFAMPPGSCPWPPEASDVLASWFDQGMPDGANYIPL